MSDTQVLSTPDTKWKEIESQIGALERDLGQACRDTAAVWRFVDVVARCDVSAMMPAWLNLNSQFACAQAFRAVSRLESVHPQMREKFLRFWIKHSDAIRGSVNDELILIDALRKLLPPYEGPVTCAPSFIQL
jgi:hypothetical protein